MIRFLFRLLATAALALAVILAVMDATRSIAISSVEWTALGYLWLEYLPGSFGAARDAFAAYGLTLLWEPVISTVLKAPAFAVFAALAFLLYAIGRRPRLRQPRYVTGY